MPADPAQQEAMEAALETQGARKRLQDLPYFYADAKKDGQLTGRLFIDRIERAAAISNPVWNDARTIREFEASLLHKALIWYNTTKYADIDDFETSWAVVKKEFLTTYDTVGTVDAAAISLEQMYCKPGESVSEFFGRAGQNFNIIADRLPAAQQEMTDAELAEIAGAADAAARRAIGRRIRKKNNMKVFKYVQKLMFLNGLPANMRSEIQTKKPETLMNAYHMAIEWEAAHKAPSSVAKVNAAKKINAIQEEDEEAEEVPVEDQEPEDEAHLNAINTFRRRKNLPVKPRPDFWKNGKPAGPGGPNKENGKPKCRYCKKPGHKQDVCRARIAAGKPLVDQFGVPWKNQNPKVNTVEETNTANLSSVQAGSLNSLRIL